MNECTGFKWFRMESAGGSLQKQAVDFSIPENRGISGLVERL